MERKETQPGREWKAQRDKVRLSSSQWFRGLHEKEIRSPISPGKRRDTIAASGRGSTTSPAERNVSLERRDTAPGAVTDVHEAADEESDQEVRNVLTAWAGSATKWVGNNAISSDSPLMSPFMVPEGHEWPVRRVSRIPRRPGSLIKSRPPRPDLTVASGVSIDPDLGSVPQSSNSGPLESTHDDLPRSPVPDQSTDETSEGGIQAVSDMSQKPDQNGTLSQTPGSSHRSERDSLDSEPQLAITAPPLVHASPIHDPVEGHIDKEVPDTTHSPGIMEDQHNNSLPKSPGRDHIRSPDSPPKSAGSDNNKHRNSQAQSPERGNVTVEISQTHETVGEDLDEEAWLKSDAPLQGNYRTMFDDPNRPTSSSSDWSSNRESGTDSLIVSPARTNEPNSEDEEDLSTSKANADTMKMSEKYKAKFPSQSSFEEEGAEADEEAKTARDTPNGNSGGWSPDRSSTSNISSDDSLLLSLDHDDNESPTKSEASQDDLRTAAEQEEDNQAALNLIDLYSENYQLRKDLEDKESKYKREIEMAWKHPRLPPSTEQQRLDQLALEEIRSKDIFDDLGEQQRPIRTDPQMVLLETDVDLMLTRAQLNYLLEHYRKMYMHANHAVEASAQLRFSPLTARCCYYRGMASYHYRDFQQAKRDFLESRRCAGLYGIMSENIERYIDLIDNAHDPETAILEFFPPPRFGRVSKARRTTTANPDVHNENEASSSTTDDVSPLIAGSSTARQDIVSPPPPFRSPSGKEHSVRQPREEANPQIQTLRRPSHLRGISLDGDPQPSTASFPNYQPQEEAISEDIRKDIFESKAQSLAGSAEANSQDRKTSPTLSMGSTECTLLGSATSYGTTRHVPRPHIAPITTSFAETPVRQASPEGTLVAGSADEMDEDERDEEQRFEEEVMAAFGGRPRSGGPQNDEFTPVEVQRKPWARSDQATIKKANEAFRATGEDQ